MDSKQSPSFRQNLKTLPGNVWRAVIRHGKTTSDRARSEAIFNNVFLHINSTNVHPHSLRLRTTWGLGVALVCLFLILLGSGVVLMIYYSPSVERAYDSVKDIHYVVPAGRLLRNMHRWAAHLMVACVILHMARVFYTSAYKAPREFNWVVGVILFVLTLALSFTGYLLPWDQLGYWAMTIGANIAASPNEVAAALHLPPAFYVGDLQKEILIGASEAGQGALLRFYMFHIVLLPLMLTLFIFVHLWRIRKDGGLARPKGTPTPAGKGAGTMTPQGVVPSDDPDKSFGLMCVVKENPPHTNLDPDETVMSWPYMLVGQSLVFMFTLLVCALLATFFDAPLTAIANATIPENPAKAPWYFLGLQELVSYSAFMGGMGIPGLMVMGLMLLPFLDREAEPAGVWWSGDQRGRIALTSVLLGAALAIMAVAVPVNFGWLREWFPTIPQILIILFNPGTLLAAAYIGWGALVLRRTQSTRLCAIAVFTAFFVGMSILTYVGTFLRGPNWDFYWRMADWPIH